MASLYPAQSRIFKYFSEKNRPKRSIRGEALERLRADLTEIYAKQGVIIRDIVLEKNGVRYSGLMMGNVSTIYNAQWVLQAVGNKELVEFAIPETFLTYSCMNYNLLMVNGPAVGNSEGHATPETVGEVQSLGLSFLETAIKAKKIVMVGDSLGGAAIGQAILQHKFKEDVQYLAVRQMTFDRASNMCAQVVANSLEKTRFRYLVECSIRGLIRWVGCEMDNVAASRKLTEKGIKEVIVQASRCEIEPGQYPKLENIHTYALIHARSSLAYRLIKEKVVENKTFHCLKGGYHDLSQLKILNAAEKEISAF